jgi:CheY-like chemotaxis protein
MRAEILVIDDQSGPREALRMILKESHNVRMAANGEEGLRMLSEREPDIVFLDVRMPGMDGTEVLAAIKQTNPDVQVAMITAYAAVETAQSAMRLGAMDYITKPFKVPDVEAVVERAAERRRSHRDARLMELQLHEISNALAERVGADGGSDLMARGAIVEGLTSAHESMQAQLSQVSRLNSLGEIAAEVNHDLNNLLSTIMLNIELLLRQIEMGQEVDLADITNTLHAMEAAAQDGSSATGRIREFLKADPYAPCEMVDLQEVVSTSLQLSSGRVSGFASRHELLNELPPLPKVWGNQAALRAVLTNILINARQALGKAGGTVRVTGRQEDGFVVVTVEDDGPGMSPEVLASATKPFFTTKSEGTGLGLSLSEKLISQHGGAMSIDSEVGRGTRVDIRLPVTAEVAAEPPVRLIMVVDDDERVLPTICQVLETAGLKTLAVRSGAEAWEQFLGRRNGSLAPVAAVLTDLDMPGMNGAELARRIKAAAPQTPVIILTGMGNAGGVLGADRAAVDAVIYKPFNIPALLKTITDAIAA